MNGRRLRRFERFAWCWLGLCVGFALYAREIPPVAVALLGWTAVTAALMIWKVRKTI